MNPTTPTPDPKLNEQPNGQVANGVQPTAGTEQSSTLGRWVPRFIIAAILINIIPSVGALFNESYRPTLEIVRNYANAAYIIAFIIIIIRELGERNAKN